MRLIDGTCHNQHPEQMEEHLGRFCKVLGTLNADGSKHSVRSEFERVLSEKARKKAEKAGAAAAAGNRTITAAVPKTLSPAECSYINDSFVLAAVKQGMSYNTFDVPEFREAAEYGRPGLKLPHRRGVPKLIHEIALDAKEEMCKELQLGAHTNVLAPGEWALTSDYCSGVFARECTCS